MWQIIVWIFLAGCSSASLYATQNGTIAIEIDGKKIASAVEKKCEDNIVLDGLLVERVEYVTGNGDPIVYEYARTQAPYKFHYEVWQSLRIIFDAQSVTRLARTGNLGFYTVRLQEGSIVFVIAQNMNKRGIKMVYGLSREQMTAIASEAGESFSIAEVSRPLSREGKAFLSRWNPKMTILDALLETEGGRPFIR